MKTTSVVDIRTATKLGLTTQPSTTATSGTALSTQPVVQIQDTPGHSLLKGNIAVLAAIVGTGTLSGTTSVISNANGVATFTDLVVTHSGGGTNTITFTATAAGLTSVTSSTITVTDSSFAAPDILSTDFSSGLTSGSTTALNFSNAATSHNTWIDDPTGAGRGKIWKQNYAYSGTGNPKYDGDYYLECDPSSLATLTFGSTFYVRGKFYFPSSGMTATWTDGTILRKLLYIRTTIGGVNQTDIVQSMWGNALWGETDTTGNSRLWSEGFITLTRDAWHDIEWKFVLDSSAGAHDGRVTVWVDDPNTPALDITMPNTESNYTGAFKVVWIAPGHQREGRDPGDGSLETSINEDRYWDNLAISTQRIGFAA